MRSSSSGFIVLVLEWNRKLKSRAGTVRDLFSVLPLQTLQHFPSSRTLSSGAQGRSDSGMGQMAAGLRLEHLKERKGKCQNRKDRKPIEFAKRHQFDYISICHVWFKIVLWKCTWGRKQQTNPNKLWSRFLPEMSIAACAFPRSAGVRSERLSVANHVTSPATLGWK